MYDISREIYSVDMANEGGWVACCGADGYLRTYFMDT